MIPNCKKIENRIIELASDKVKFKRMIWGNSLEFNFELDQVGIAILGYNSIYIVWRNGGGLVYNLVAGEALDFLKITVSEDNSKITFYSETESFAMTMFYA